LSRNKNRVGSQAPDTNTPPQMHHDDGGGFSFVVPTEFVELPSQGKFYPEGHPLCGEDSIEVRQMTAKEEDILTSRTLLKKGVALDRVLSNVIADKRISTDDLLVGDRNAIIIAARVSGYGNDYDTSVACPNCLTVQKYRFDLNHANIYHGAPEEGLEVVDNQNGTFATQLPKTQLSVTFCLLTGKSEKSFLAGVEADRKNKNQHERAVTRHLRSTLVSVNGNSTPEAINYTIENIPSMDARHIRLAYKQVAPDIDLTQHFACENCDHEEQMEVPLTADFFWPDR